MTNSEYDGVSESEALYDKYSVSLIKPVIFSSEPPLLSLFLPRLACLMTFRKGFPRSLDLAGSESVSSSEEDADLYSSSFSVKSGHLTVTLHPVCSGDCGVSEKRVMESSK